MTEVSTTREHAFDGGRRAVVTGASSGIGAETARVLAKDGWQVVLLARRQDKLEALVDEIESSGGVGSYVVCDITDEESTDAAVRRIIAEGPVKALINCAGGAIGKDPVASADLDDWRAMYELNVIGTLRITQKLLPTLKESEGTVLIVSSTAGIEPYEGGAGYCASKFAERVMARVLRLEQIGEPVRIIDISPGMVKTDEFAVKRFGGDADKAADVYAGVPDPLHAGDIAESIRWAVDLPDTVDVDSLVIRPRAEGSYTKLDRRS
ncbi:SDR family oxidoreductase [Bifidobacterium psychraerophilum]|uniref:SDR family oxidoreductase n=1 Tax=Bifidobacterium psychraerophilum TaxID=218140 RepID=UPI0039EC17F1